MVPVDAFNWIIHYPTVLLVTIKVQTLRRTIMAAPYLWDIQTTFTIPASYRYQIFALPRHWVTMEGKESNLRPNGCPYAKIWSHLSTSGSTSPSRTVFPVSWPRILKAVPVAQALPRLCTQLQQVKMFLLKMHMAVVLQTGTIRQGTQSVIRCFQPFVRLFRHLSCYFSHLI